MAKDPAMLWYWADWNSGTITLSRFLKGCYMDVLHAQFNNGPLSVEEVKTVLGSDFGQSWPAIQKKFKNENGLFFNERLELEKVKRQKHSEKQKNNASMRWHKSGISQINTKGVPLENTNENENRNVNEIENERLADYEKWTNLILDNSDNLFEVMVMNAQIKCSPDRFQELVSDHLELLNRYPNMKPPSQQAFRKSALKHIRENKDKVNGTSKKQQHTDSLVEGIIRRHGLNAEGKKV